MNNPQLGNTFKLQCLQGQQLYDHIMYFFVPLSATNTVIIQDVYTNMHHEHNNESLLRHDNMVNCGITLMIHISL